MQARPRTTEGRPVKIRPTKHGTGGSRISLKGEGDVGLLWYRPVGS